MENTVYPRQVVPRVLAALKDSPVVLLNGAHHVSITMHFNRAMRRCCLMDRSKRRRSSLVICVSAECGSVGPGRGSRGGPADECHMYSSIDSVVEKQDHTIPGRLHPLAHAHERKDRFMTFEEAESAMGLLTPEGPKSW